MPRAGLTTATVVSAAAVMADADGLEALTLGLLGAAAGLAGGIGFAYAINELFKAVGIDLPNTGTVLETRTVVVSLIVGVVVTLVAALNPRPCRTTLKPTRVSQAARVRHVRAA